MQAAKYFRLAVGAVIALIALGSLGGCDCNQAAEDGDDGAEEVEDQDLIAEEAYQDLEDIEEVEPEDIGPEAPTLYFTSGLSGYTEPCGCTADVLLGGIDRITAFMLDVAGLHDEMTLIDAGDWIFEFDEVSEYLQPQEKAKAGVLADAHRRMGTQMSVPGSKDLAMGVEFYEEMMERANMEAVAVNVELAGQALQGVKTMEFADQRWALVGATDPNSMDRDIDGVAISDPAPAVQEALEGVEADAVVLVYQGDATAAEAMVNEVEGIDFVIVGHNPRRSNAPRTVGASHLLEAYDQGRYVGRLKLYGGQQRTESFVDARAGAQEQRQVLENEKERVRADLRRLDLRTGGQETDLTQRLRERLEDLEERRARLMRENLEFPEGRRSFIYDLIPMEPGLRLDEEIQNRRIEFNMSLAELNAQIERDPLPVEEGEAFFVGQDQCATCHGAAHDFWKETSHASAVETLEVRHKQYDQNCIGCHVDGWEQPGGSVLGNIKYESELRGESFMKDLHEVGCESCHGAGSNHLLEPLDEVGEPQHINRHPTEENCVTCHVPDHSPTFDFEIYVQEITGEGHEYRGGSGQ